MRAMLCVGAAVAALAACGGSTFVDTGHDAGGDGGGSGSGGSSGAGSGSGGSSSGSGGGSSSGASSGSSSGIGGGGGCPASTPTAGSACSPSGISCEYGNDPNPECNVIVTCQGNAGWSAPPPGVHCMPGTCPATYADVPQGKGLLALWAGLRVSAGAVQLRRNRAGQRAEPGVAVLDASIRMPRASAARGQRVHLPGPDVRLRRVHGRRLARVLRRLLARRPGRLPGVVRSPRTLSCARCGGPRRLS